MLYFAKIKCKIMPNWLSEAKENLKDPDSKEEQ